MSNAANAAVDATGAPPRVRFHEHLRALRERQGMTRAQLAEACSMRVEDVERMESNERRPGRAFTAVLAAALGESFGALWSVIEQDQPPPTRLPPSSNGHLNALFDATDGFSAAEWDALIACAQVIRKLGRTT